MSSSHQSQVPSYSSLLSNFWGSHFSYRHPERSRGIFLALRQYHISTDMETTPWCYVFLRSHRHRLSVCKKDFSLRSK